MYVIIESLYSWTFHFLAGMICMIEAKNAKKNLVTVFCLARHTLLEMKNKSFYPV